MARPRTRKEKGARLPRTVLLPLLLATTAVAEAPAVPAVPGPAVSQQVGEACVNALAAREGKSPSEIVQFITDELTLQGQSVVSSSNDCDIALATASPVAIYFESLSNWLHDTGPVYQLLVATSAVAVGLACAWDGPAIWRALFTAVAAAAAAGVTHHEASLWGLAPNLISEIVLMGQAAAAVALAVHVGFEGSQVLFGVLLGLIGAYGLGDWARSLEANAPGLCLLWYEVGAVGGFLLYTVWRKAVLSTLAPLLGGFLVTVGTFVLLVRGYALIAGSSDGDSESHASLLPSANDSWLSAATSLLGNAGAMALPVHCACAMVATFVHGCLEVRPLTVVCLLFSIVVAALSSVTGFLCQVWPSKLEANSWGCPAWLEKTPDWQWPVFGCVVWAGLTGASAWRQLHLLEAWEQNNFWRSEISSMYADVASARRVMASEEVGVDSPSGNFRTKMPGGYDGARVHHDVDQHGYYMAGHPSAPPGAPQPSNDNPFAGFINGLERWWADVNTSRGHNGQY